MSLSASRHGLRCDSTTQRPVDESPRDARSACFALARPAGSMTAACSSPALEMRCHRHAAREQPSLARIWPVWCGPPRGERPRFMDDAARYDERVTTCGDVVAKYIVYPIACARSAYYPSRPPRRYTVRSRFRPVAGATRPDREARSARSVSDRAASNPDIPSYINPIYTYDRLYGTACYRPSRLRQGARPGRATARRSSRARNSNGGADRPARVPPTVTTRCGAYIYDRTAHHTPCDRYRF